MYLMCTAVYCLLVRFITTLRGHVGRVYQITWSADSRLVCSGSSDSTVIMLFKFFFFQYESFFKIDSNEN